MRFEPCLRGPQGDSHGWSPSVAMFAEPDASAKALRACTTSSAKDLCDFWLLDCGTDGSTVTRYFGIISVLVSPGAGCKSNVMYQLLPKMPPQR